MKRFPSILSSVVHGLALAVLVSLLAGCGAKVMTLEDPTMAIEQGRFTAPVNHWPEEGQHAFEFLDIYDPWEPMNRHLYSFNAGLDAYVVLPATTVYETVLPSPVQTGIHNMIQNANEIPTFINCILQGKFEKGAITTSRFFINTTMGVLGLWDLASRNEQLPLQKEDVGQTLGVWGFGNGPYFVMPLLGPSNLRDTVGFGGDFLLLLMEMKLAYKTLGVKNTKTVAITELLLRGLDRRANTPFRYHSTGSPFEYEMIRFIYTKQRELDIGR